MEGCRASTDPWTAVGTDPGQERPAILDLDEKDRMLVLLDVMHGGIRIMLCGEMVMSVHGA
jgi:hypothetical protein